MRRRIRAILIAWLTLGLALLYMTMEVSRFYSLGLIALMAAVAGYTMTRKCPNCAKPLLYNPQAHPLVHTLDVDTRRAVTM